MLLLTLATWLAAAVLALIVTPLAMRLAPRLGLLDRPGGYKRQDAPVPYAGAGLVVAALAAGLAALLARYWVLSTWRHAGERPTALHVLFLVGAPRGEPGIRGRLAWIAGLSVAVFLLGLADDRWRLRPRTKLAAEVAIALVLAIAADVRITFFIESYPISVALTVIWVVGITNTMNLLDNTDGVAAGAAAVAAAVFALVALGTGQARVAVALAALSGGAAGFLRYNFHPARAYMGDAGSLWLGFVLASLPIAATFYREGGSMLAAAMPLLILAVPIFDTATVLAIRLREGRPLFKGDRSHFAHRLVDLGMSVREAAMTIYLLTASVGLGALVLKDLSGGAGFLVVSQAAGLLAVVALLESAARRRAK